MDIILGILLFVLFFSGMAGIIYVGLLFTRNFSLPEKFGPTKIDEKSFFVKIFVALESRLIYSVFFYAPFSVIIILFRVLTFALCSDIEKGFCLYLGNKLDKIFEFFGSLLVFSPRSIMYLVVLILIPHLLRQLTEKLNDYLKVISGKRR